VPGLCLECHAENERMMTAHQGRSFGDTDCNACHDPHASPLKGLVRANQHRPFAAGNCQQCHGEVGRAGSFAVGGGIQEMCLDCHKSQESYRRAENKHIMTTGESCVACHNPHASNGEALLVRDQFDLCMSCHFNDQPNPDKTHYVTHDGMDCVQCHLPHGGDDPQLLITRGSQLCAGCHERAHAVSHPAGDDIIDPRTGEGMHCLSCHQLHGADFPQYLPLNPDMALCIQCHKK
jgi:predicted CXXCH cytochrome family protein